MRERRGRRRERSDSTWFSSSSIHVGARHWGGRLRPLLPSPPCRTTAPAMPASLPLPALPNTCRGAAPTAPPLMACDRTLAPSSISNLPWGSNARCLALSTTRMPACCRACKTPPATARTAAGAFCMPLDGATVEGDAVRCRVAARTFRMPTRAYWMARVFLTQLYRRLVWWDSVVLFFPAWRRSAGILAFYCGTFSLLPLLDANVPTSLYPPIPARLFYQTDGTFGDGAWYTCRFYAVPCRICVGVRHFFKPCVGAIRRTDGRCLNVLLVDVHRYNVERTNTTFLRRCLPSSLYRIQHSPC